MRGAHCGAAGCSPVRGYTTGAAVAAATRTTSARVDAASNGTGVVGAASTTTTAGSRDVGATNSRSQARATVTRLVRAACRPTDSTSTTTTASAGNTDSTTSISLVGCAAPSGAATGAATTRTTSTTGV